MRNTFTGYAKRVRLTVVVMFVSALLLHVNTFAQSLSRVKYAGKEVFLSGINGAWVNFASDLGPNAPNLNQFKTVFQQVRNSGGNALRLWLYTNGSNAPEYNNQGYVTGPGQVAIPNLKQILSLAYRYRVGLVLCLWSFDMLRKTELDSARLYANQKMLTDTAYTMAFVRNALTPMVDSVKGDSAIIAWEICNEPNGMTTGMNYYTGDPTVSQDAIQRFTNLLAGAIHRTDPNALVTTGPGSFQTLTDVNPPAAAKKSELRAVSSLSLQQLQDVTDRFNATHRLDLTPQQMQDYLKRIAVMPDSNYYSDNDLISAGGDSLGTLDFYSVHYYYYGPSSTALSPFTHPFSYWNLDKPTVIAEFYATNTDGVADTSLIPALYIAGYAGGLVWSWTDFPTTPNSPNAAKDTWFMLHKMWDLNKQDIDVFGADWPDIAIVNPVNSTSYPDSSNMTIIAVVVDTGASIASVQFFAADTLKGTATVPYDTASDTLYYSYQMKNLSPGSYSVYAMATNSQGQQNSTGVVNFSVGTPPMAIIAANKATVTGANITLKSSSAVSGGFYLDVQTNDTNAAVTWTFTNVLSAGVYPVSFAYNLNYDAPKTQFVNVNGVRVDTLTFSGTTQTWREKTIEVALAAGVNKVQMQMFWGWIYLGYLAVPKEIITSVASSSDLPTHYSIEQNYPNPFNPSTVISYQLSAVGQVNLKVYDVLGREVAVLVNGVEKPGRYEVRFDGRKLASGVYFYRLTAGSFTGVKKMLLLK